MIVRYTIAVCDMTIYCTIYILDYNVIIFLVIGKLNFTQNRLLNAVIFAIAGAICYYSDVFAG